MCRRANSTGVFSTCPASNSPSTRPRICAGSSTATSGPTLPPFNGRQCAYLERSDRSGAFALEAGPTYRLFPQTVSRLLRTLSESRAALRFGELRPSGCGAVRRVATGLRCGRHAVLRRQGRVLAQNAPSLFGSAGTARQVDQGSSSVGLRRDFPEEFKREWDAWQASAANDGRLQAVVERLEAEDVAVGERTASRVYQVPAIRPAWYYRHVVKAMFRKHFPERARVID